MRTLTPGQKLHFKAILTMGGNGLAKAMPAHGSGNMSVNSGDYFLTTVAAIDQVGNGEGEVIVPNGGPGSTMIIFVSCNETAYGALGGTLEIYYKWVEGTPTPTDTHGSTADPLGSRLDVNEVSGQWLGVWTRRPGTKIFDAVWHSGATEVRDVIRIESITGNKVVLKRDGNGGSYYGTISSDGRTIAGTASWYSAGMTWSARLGGR